LQFKIISVTFRPHRINFRHIQEETQMKKMFARVVLCVLALSLVSLAADNTVVTTSPVKGGQPAKVERDSPAFVPLFTTMASADPKGLYYCCSGNYVVGPNNSSGIPPFAEAAQFVLTKASHIKQISTSVNYAGTVGTSTQFELSIQQDASGVPSGTKLAAYKVNVNSQAFGACCAVENVNLTGAGKALAAGTYWVVWSSTSATSDLISEVNQAILDEVDAANVAYSASNGVTGSWNAYTTTLPFVVRIRGTQP
jgi:hypothetical protein